jgi:mRNA interferase RelE/StbE
VSYAVSVLRAAAKQLERVSEDSRKRILGAVSGLAATPRPEGCIKLTGRPAWRIRVGDYRVIYEIDDSLLEVTVVAIGHRKDVYR